MSFSEYEDKIQGKKSSMLKSTLFNLMERVQYQQEEDIMLFGEFKMEIVLDDTLPPGTIEMRTAENRIRMFHYSVGDPGGKTGS